MLSDETEQALAQLKINPNKIPYRSVVGNSERHVDRNCRGELADTSHLVYLTGNGLYTVKVPRIALPRTDSSLFHRELNIIPQAQHRKSSY